MIFGYYIREGHLRGFNVLRRMGNRVKKMCKLYRRRTLGNLTSYIIWTAAADRFLISMFISFLLGEQDCRSG